MSLEQKFEALMKTYQSISSSNQELKNQNEYLRRKLGEALKQKKKLLNLQLSPTKEMKVKLKLMRPNQKVRKQLQKTYI